MTVERYSNDQISQQDYPVKNDSARRIGRIGGKENFSFLPSQTVWFFSGILFFALLLRLFIAMAYQNSFDTEWYITWARGLQNGFFNAYDGHVGTSHYPLDYPPVYLYCLKLVGMALENPAVDREKKIRDGGVAGGGYVGDESKHHFQLRRLGADRLHDAFFSCPGVLGV